MSHRDGHMNMADQTRESGAIEALDTFLTRYREEGTLEAALDEDTSNNITGMSEDAFDAYGAMFDALRKFFGEE